MNETEQNSIEEENTTEENNTTVETTEDNTTNTIVFENKIDEIAYNTSVISNTGLFFVAFIVVIFVCFLLLKVLDNFISF